MPPTCKVSVEEAVALILQFENHFSNGKFPAWKDPVWKEMSAVVKNRWTFESVYLNVHQNKRNIYTIAMEKMGVEPYSINDQNNNSSLIADSRSLHSNESDDGSDWNPCLVGNKLTKRKDHDTFDLYLDEDQWNSIKPKDCESIQKLQSRVWTNVIAIEFWRLYRFPCAFVFKNSYVRLSEDKLSYVLQINGKCKSAKCGNTFQGTAIKKLLDVGLLIRVDTRDTRCEVHDFVKRPFNGKLRKNAHTQLKALGSAGYRKDVARENMRPGDTEQPFMPSDDVARRAKKEGDDAELGIEKDDGRDLIRTIENMKNDPKYAGVIHETASDPFHVFYSTQPQLSTYKEYCRLHKGSSTICVDATGSVVRPLKRGSTTSGHIFLYAIVVNFESTTVAVGQMLSEHHDTEFIEYWLKRWLRKAGPNPKEAVCDYSRALLCALSLAFNNMTTKTYINSFFNSILRGITNTEKPRTLIRVDVAHLIHLVCRWKCFTIASQTCIKDFFVRCVALMVECRTLDTFKEIFSLTCVVALQTHEDSEIDPSLAKTTKSARIKLENYIASRGIKANFIESRNKSVGNGNEEAIVDPFDTPLGPDESEIEVFVNEWIDQQVEKAKKNLRPGKDINPFYLPTFITSLSKLCKEFPLWTSVVMPYSRNRATSSYVESYFNDIKTRVSKTAPLRVDAVLKIHIKDIVGANFVFSSKMIKHNTERLDENENRMTPSEYSITDISCFIDIGVNEHGHYVLDDSDLRSAENWRGKGGVLDAEVTNNVIDDDEMFNSRIYDLSVSTQPQTEPMEISFDGFEDDHSYCKLNESNASLNRSTNKMSQFDPDIFRTSSIEKENALNNNPATKNPEHARCGLEPVIARDSNSSPEATPKQDCVAVLPSMGGRLTGNDRIDLSFNNDKHESHNDEVVRKHCGVAAKTTEVRSSTPNDDDKIDLSFNNDKHESHNDEIVRKHCGVEAKTTEVRSSTPNDQQPHSQKRTISSNNAAAKRQPVPSSTKTSKYFVAYPEIRHKNTLVTKTKKPSLIPNGSKCRLVKISGLQYFVQNTCPFDAIVQTIMTAAIDNVHYHAFIEKSTNPTLKLVRDLIHSGITQRLLVDRAIILKEFCKSTCQVKTDARVLSTSIDAFCCIETMVEEILASEPSVRNTEDCPNSGRKTYSTVSLQIDFKPIRRHGFRALAKALGFSSPIHNVRCRDQCTGSFTWFRELNLHVIIILDVRKYSTSQNGMTCALKEIPLMLQLPSSTGILQDYRLAGIVGYRSAHYVAYCRRANGSWQEYDDMSTKIKLCGELTIVEPHLALYVRTE